MCRHPTGNPQTTSFFAESPDGEEVDVEAESEDGTTEDNSSDNEGSNGDNVTEEPERHDPYADCDNGEPLTPKECTQILMLSTYEQVREMNICMTKQMEVSLISEFRALTGDLKKTPPKSLPASSGKHVSDGSVRRSSRNKAAE